MTRNEREVVRRVESDELDRGTPCWVGPSGDVEPCKRPSTFPVYGGIALCPEHGEEAALGAHEERTETALLGAFPFRADKADPEKAGDIEPYAVAL